MDDEIRDKFQNLYVAALVGSLAGWDDDASGALVLVIVLDQFRRNMFRGSAAAFAADPLARAVAGRAIVQGFDRQPRQGGAAVLLSAVHAAGHQRNSNKNSLLSFSDQRSMSRFYATYSHLFSMVVQPVAFAGALGWAIQFVDDPDSNVRRRWTSRSSNRTHEKTLVPPCGRPGR